MGSRAYACEREDSDFDIYGFAIPPREDLFPHLRGEIIDFSRPKNRFGQWEELHLTHPDTGMEYGFTVYSITKYFRLVMDGNPNMVDSLWTADNCVLHTSKIGQLVRDNRKMFLSKKCYHTFKGYSFAQIKKLQLKTPLDGSKRDEDVKAHGYDTKYAYHLYRLISECEQILQEGSVDLQRDNELYKAVRRGEKTQEEVLSYFAGKEKYLEQLYEKSTIPYSADEDKIRDLLVQCLEIHYKDGLKDAITIPNAAESALREIAEICAKTLK